MAPGARNQILQPNQSALTCRRSGLIMTGKGCCDRSLWLRESTARRDKGTAIGLHPGSGTHLAVVAATPDGLSGILLGWITGARRSMATHVANVRLPGRLD